MLPPGFRTVLFSAALIWPQIPQHLRDRFPAGTKEVFDGLQASTGEEQLPFINILEVFAGCCTWGRAFEDANLCTVCIDIGHVHEGFSADLATDDGFTLATALVLLILPGALVLYAFPCNSMVSSSRATYCRTLENPEGNDAALPYNELAARVFLLAAVVECRFGINIFEQPPPSMLFKLGCREVLQHVYSSVPLVLGSFGAPFLKPIHLWTSAAHIGWLRGLKSGESRPRDSLPVARHYTKADGRRGYTGDDHQQASQMYPPALGEAFVDLYKANVDFVAAVSAVYPACLPASLRPSQVKLSQKLVGFLQLYACLAPAMDAYRVRIGVPARTLAQLAEDGVVTQKYARHAASLLGVRRVMRRPAAAKAKSLNALPLSLLSKSQRDALAARGRQANPTGRPSVKRPLRFIAPSQR